MSIWRKSAFVAEVVAEDEGRVALLNLGAEKPVVLTRSAAIIWGLIDGTRTEADILAKLRDIYVTASAVGSEGSPAAGGSDEMARQLGDFLAQLEQQGLAEAVA